MQHQPSPTKIDPAPTAPITPALLLCALLAILIDFSHFHLLQNSDSIIPVLTSLYSWTPFYWEAIRFGQLLPLLAMPFHNPLTNLLVQSGLSIFCGLATIFLFARYFQRGQYWGLTGALTLLVFILAADPTYLSFLLTPGQCYGVSLFLVLSGLILLEDFPGLRHAAGKFALATFCILLAHWVNSATALLFAPLILLRYLCGRQITRKECVAGLILNVVSFFALFLVSYVVRITELQLEDPLFPFSLASPDTWPARWRAVSVTLFARTKFLMLIIGALFSFSILAALPTASGRQSLRKVIWQIPPVVIAGTSFSLLMSTLFWVSAEDHWIWRYAYPASLMLPILLICIATAPWWPGLITPRTHRSVSAIATVLLLAATLHLFGRPSFSQVRRDIDRVCGKYTADLRATRSTHLAGNYWEVWPTMFHANLVAFERGESPVWGMAYRSTALQSRWRETVPDEFKIAWVGANTEHTNITQPLCFDPHEMQPQSHGVIQTASPPELFLLWARGFYPQEGPPDTRFHWSRNNSELWLCNRTRTAQQVRLQMQLYRDQGTPAPLRITSDWFNEVRVVSSTPTSLDQTFTLLPGWHTVRFNCDADRIVPEDFTRHLVFRVFNPRVTKIPDLNMPDERTQPASSPSGSSRSAPLATRPDQKTLR